ncbi:MAG: phosphonopyruvate decarboxylase [Myxococcales bacterium]|nr:phosphonopyruvate decarboxylase [Myxococcales bacterium]MDD9966386.1 phosphonopyruvate decarboxylase [Myxococcales bacterium]
MQIESFGEILKQHGVYLGAGVPCSYFTPLVNYMTIDPELDYLSATSEGEAVAIAAGMTTAGKPAFALMQNSGLGNAINPVTSMLYIYRMPVILLVSHRGQPGRPDEPQHALMGQITEELSTLCGMRTHVLSPERFTDEVAQAHADGVPAAWICRKGTLEGGPQAPPLAFEVNSSAATPSNQGRFKPTLSREQAIGNILPLLNRGLDAGKAPAVIATTGKLSRELYELDDRDFSRSNRFYMVGSMGCALGFGLGVARARPGRPVVVLDGDGSLLMKLGSLATVGFTRPQNLHHVVLDNGAHDSTGGQPTPSPAVDFAALAMAAGYRLAETVDDGPTFQNVLERHLRTEGPTLLRMLITTGSRKDLGRPRLSPRDAYLRFRAFVTDSPWSGPEESESE